MKKKQLTRQLVLRHIKTYEQQRDDSKANSVKAMEHHCDEDMRSWRRNTEHWNARILALEELLAECK